MKTIQKGISELVCINDIDYIKWYLKREGDFNTNRKNLVMGGKEYFSYSLRRDDFIEKIDELKDKYPDVFWTK